MKRIIVLLIISCFASGCAATHWEQLPEQTALLLADAPPDTEVAIACLDNKEILQHGFVKSSDGWEQVRNADAVFEIGSLTKLYTAYIAAQLVLKGDIQLDDPMKRYIESLDANSKTPGIGNITFKDLLTHTSGLPFLPSDLTDMPVINSNPFQGYSKKRLLNYLQHQASLTKPSDQYRYSNMGYALLGLALEGATGTSYDELLSQYVTTPFSLMRTGLQRSQLQPLVQGQNPDGSAAAYWDFDAFQSSGGIYSSPNEVIVFIQTQLDAANPAAALMHHHHHRTAGLGWALQQRKATTWLEQTGATGGFTSAVMIQPEMHTGALVLSNLSGLHPRAHQIANLAQWVLNTQCQ